MTDDPIRTNLKELDLTTAGDIMGSDVNAKGKIKARKTGTCYIYMMALNGVKNKVRVTVK
ncbi:MAG: hypothetical protein Q4B57_03690 [Eubacteriales bacterium]|nr:hypothetical protein [Eubacteriales bacterium]